MTWGELSRIIMLTRLHRDCGGPGHPRSWTVSWSVKPEGCSCLESRCSRRCVSSVTLCFLDTQAPAESFCGTSLHTWPDGKWSWESNSSENEDEMISEQTGNVRFWNYWRFGQWWSRFFLINSTKLYCKHANMIKWEEQQSNVMIHCLAWSSNYLVPSQKVSCSVPVEMVYIIIFFRMIYCFYTHAEFSLP